MNSQNLMKLGKRLRDAREAAGLSQSAVAQQAGLSANFYAMVERGERNISYERLQPILKVLKIQSLDIS